MSFNSWCTFTNLTVSNSNSVYHEVTLAARVVTALLAPMTVAANGFILAAISRNPSLRTPSYVLLAGLAFTDLYTGLLSQPLYAVVKLARKEVLKRKTDCILHVLTDCIGYYFLTLTILVIMMTAVERWLHMSRSSLLTVRRVIIIYVSLFVALLLLLVPVRLYAWYYREKAHPNATVLYFLLGTLCMLVTAYSYFKVFKIIRHHQNQVQTNENAIDIKKYKRSIFTILCILAVFVVSYVPYMCLTGY